MAAAVAHGLAQTYLDKPWANAYSLSFLPDAVKAAPPTSSVQGGDDPVELGISLPVEEWGESGIGVGVDAGDAREGVPAKRKSEDEATSDDHREVPTSETGTGRRRHLSPLPVFPQNSYEVENRRKGMPHLNRPYPLPQPQNRPTSARPCSPIPPKSPPSSAGLVEDSQGFDFVSSAATGERSHKRRRSTASRGTNRDRPPESPFLTNEMLFPSLRDLKFQDYQPLLLDKPVTPVWSAALYELLLQFFRFCEPCESWAKDPTQLSVGAGLPSIVRKVLRYQPNHRAIQAIYTPAVAPGYDALGQRLKYKFRAMRDVMRWLLDDRLLKVDTVAHLVRYAPLPLHILVRELAGVIHLSELTQHAERELTQHLDSRRRLSPHQAAAVVLLRWLQQPRNPNRHYTFFCRPDGSLRFDEEGQPPWAWWFKRVETGDPCMARVLDEWEKHVLATEDWSSF